MPPHSSSWSLWLCPHHRCGYRCTRLSSWSCGSPWSSSWPSPVALVAMPPCSSLWSCGAPAIVVTVGALKAVGAPLVVLVAMQCCSLIFMVVWTPPGCCHGHWCPPPLVLIAVGAFEAVGVPRSSPGASLSRWCSPVIVVAMLWPCGAPLVIVMAVPGHPQLCPPACPCGRVVPQPSSWVPPCRPCRRVVPACPCGRVEPPRSLSWPCGAFWPLVPFPACPCHCGCPQGHVCPPIRPLVPHLAVGAPGHRGGCVVAMWCPPAHPCHRECPPWSSWLCGGPPAHCRGCVVSPGSSLWSWCPPPIVLKGVGAYVHGVRPTPQPPPIGCSCGGHFVVVMVVMEMKG